MKSSVKKRMGLQSKLYFILLIPLIVIGVIVLWTTNQSIYPECFSINHAAK